MISLDIPMPANCDECRFLDTNHDYPICLVNGLSCGDTFNIQAHRMPHCPLISDEAEEDPMVKMELGDLVWNLDSFHSMFNVTGSKIIDRVTGKEVTMIMAIDLFAQRMNEGE